MARCCSARCKIRPPAVNGKGGADIRRMVLLPTYAITDNIIFNAEIEWEHGGFSPDGTTRCMAKSTSSRSWIDFKFVDQFNWRAPGIDLVPIGYINQHHEPTQFYSVLRPEIYNGLIPSTWMAPASSVYGSIADGLRYQIMLSSSIEDFGDDFACARTPTPCLRFRPAIPQGSPASMRSAFSRPTIGDFRQLNNRSRSRAGSTLRRRLLPGLAGSTSAYFTPNTTPRGAYADDGTLLGRSSLTMVDSEFRYRIPNTGLELRGEGVFVTFGNPANLRANNDSDPTDNVGKTMYGFSGEFAFISRSARSCTANGRPCRSIAIPTEPADRGLRRNRSEHAYRSRDSRNSTMSASPYSPRRNSCSRRPTRK